MTRSGRAWRDGEDPQEVARRVRLAHERFVATGRTGSRVRPLVAASWQRCVSTGLDPEASLAPVALVDDELERLRTGHPLASALPVIRRLLVDDATDAGLLVAVSDAAGRLLWVEGQSRLRSRAEQMHFVEGADWSEDRAGTNAPGTALALDQPVQIFGAEHLSRRVTAWSCSAAPIHDPDTGAVLGALDLTGGDEVAAPYALSLVRATVAAVESELRLQRLTNPGGLLLPPGAGSVPQERTHLQALGRDVALLRRPHSVSRLSPRHSEILVLLSHHPDGLSGEQLAVGLHEQEVASVTLRAEMSRLRAILGPGSLESRPYRLVDPVASDADDVAHLLLQGHVEAAVDLYRGPLLPASEAPAVQRMRNQLHENVRGALLHRGDPDALLRFGDTEHGRYDWQVWHAAWAALPAASSRRAQVETHLQYLNDEIGGGPRVAARR